MKKTISPQELAQKLGTDTAPLVLDIRRQEDAQADTRSVPGAHRQDPTKVAEWVDGLPKDREVVVYCQHGRSVSSSVQAALAERGIAATVLDGGLCGWAEATRRS